MTKPIDPYSRVYWRVLHDDRFIDIRGDMRHFGSWTLMLLVADMAYPAPAFVPPTVPRASLSKLSECGLIELLPGALYRVHGMASERARRFPSGTAPEPHRTPAGTRPEPNGNRTGVHTRARDARVDETRREEKSQEESSQAPARRNGFEPIANVLPRVDLEPSDSFGVSENESRVFSFIARHGASIRPDQGLGLRLLGLMERRGVEEVLRHAGIMAKANEKLSDRQWVFGLEGALESVPNAKDAVASEDAAKRSERIRADMLARRLERFRQTGEWDESLGPRPELAS